PQTARGCDRGAARDAQPASIGMRTPSGAPKVFGNTYAHLEVARHEIHQANRRGRIRRHWFLGGRMLARRRTAPGSIRGATPGLAIAVPQMTPPSDTTTIERRRGGWRAPPLVARRRSLVHFLVAEVLDVFLGYARIGGRHLRHA